MTTMNLFCALARTWRLIAWDVDADLQDGPSLLGGTSLRNEGRAGDNSIRRFESFIRSNPLPLFGLSLVGTGR